MNILFVAHSGEISGGANRSLLALMAGLRERYGVQPSVLIPGKNTPLEQRCKVLGIPVYVGNYHTCCTVFHHMPKDILRAAKLLLAPTLDRREARRLNKTLPADFDLYYTNERMACVGAYLARFRKKPHVWHARSFGRENRTWFPPFWYARMNRYADRIILVSEALYRDFARYIGREKLRTVHNGLEPERYEQSEHRPHEGFRLLLVGRLTPAKGQEDAVRALHLLVNQYGVDAYLSFAGSVPSYESQRYDEKLKKLAERFHLENRVSFLGETDALNAVRGETDAELVCSWQEPFGRAAVEAMMAELPVVGSHAGGTAEIILDGTTGLLYPPRDAAALAERLHWLWEHPGEAAQMGRAGKERALTCFSADTMLARVMEVLHELC